MSGEPFDDGTFFDDGTGWRDGPAFAPVTLRIRSRLSSSVTWQGNPVPGPELVAGRGSSMLLDRVDDFGEVAPSPAFHLAAVTLRLYLLPLSTPVYTPENQEKFLIATSQTFASGTGSFSIERKGDRLAAYVHQAGSKWFDDAFDGLPHALLPEGKVSCIELIQGPGGAKLRLDGQVVAHHPAVTAGWQQAPAIGLRIGTWSNIPVARILTHGFVGPLEVYPFELADSDRPPPASFSLPPGPPLPPGLPPAPPQLP